MGSHNDFFLRSSRTSATGICLSFSSRCQKPCGVNLPHDCFDLRRPSFTVIHFGPLGVSIENEIKQRLRRFLASRSRLPGRMYLLIFDPLPHTPTSLLPRKLLICPLHRLLGCNGPARHRAWPILFAQFLAGSQRRPGAPFGEPKNIVTAT